MEKFSGTPTPSISPAATHEPVDPADIVQVDTDLESGTLTVDGHLQNKTLTCDKFDRVMINGGSNIVTINGACRQIMINGNGNQVTTDAAMEFVINGSENSLRYARFVNGKRPSIIENRPGNIIEKRAIEPGKNNRSIIKNRK